MAHFGVGATAQSEVGANNGQPATESQGLREAGAVFERAPHGGLRVDLARHPHAAVIALVHGMVRTIMPDGYVVELPMGVKAQPQAPLLSRLFAAAA